MFFADESSRRPGAHEVTSMEDIVTQAGPIQCEKCLFFLAQESHSIRSMERIISSYSDFSMDYGFGRLDASENGSLIGTNDDRDSSIFELLASRDLKRPDRLSADAMLS